MKQLLWLAALAIVTTACVAEIDTTAHATPARPTQPVVTSTSDSLTGHVVTINGYTYNCVRAEDGSLGVALWCDKVDSHG